MNFFKVDTEFILRNKWNATNELNFTLNSQDCFFQLKYLHNMGMDLVDQEYIRYMACGLPVSKINILELETISTWGRTITSYKKKLRHNTTLSNSIDLFSYCPIVENMGDKSKKAKELAAFFEQYSNIRGRYYYTSLLEEYRLIDGTFSAERAISLLEDGVNNENCSGCATKLLYIHIEPHTLNNWQPDYNCNIGIGYLLKALKHNGLFEYVDHSVDNWLLRLKSAEFLRYFAIYLTCLSS